MSSFRIDDKDKGVGTNYWIYLEEVSLDFSPSWTPQARVRINMEWQYGSHTRTDFCMLKDDCPRSLVWKPSIGRHRFFTHVDVRVEYEGRDGELKLGGVVAGWKAVVDLARSAVYQGGIAHLQIEQAFAFGTSTVRLIVRRTFSYHHDDAFRLRVVIEYITHNEWSHILKYQRRCSKRYVSDMVDEVSIKWRGNERVIEGMPKSRYQNDQNDVTNVLGQAAHESMPLVLKYRHAQSKAAERGLSLDDFLWEVPNHHETRVVRAPPSQTGTPLRALILDIHIEDIILHARDPSFFITSIDLTTTSITRSPSLPNNLSSCTLRLDPRYAAWANATIPNHSAQITEIITDSQSPSRVITICGSIHVNGPLKIMGPVMGDMFAAPIYGGNVGGHNNTNHFTAPLTAEAVASAVVRALDSRPCDGGRFVPQPEVGRKRKRDDKEDTEGPSKRQFRPMSFISRFCAALFSP